MTEPETEPELLSLRAYARSRRARGLRGGTLKTIQRAVRAGRLTLEANGRINPTKADACWETTISPDAQVRRASQTLANGAGEEAQGDVRRFLRARADREESSAELKSLELGEKRQELLAAAEVQAGVNNMLFALRNALLQIPDRLREPLRSLVDADLAWRICHVVLKEIRGSLIALAKAPLLGRAEGEPVPILEQQVGLSSEEAQEAYRLRSRELEHEARRFVHLRGDLYRELRAFPGVLAAPGVERALEKYRSIEDRLFTISRTPIGEHEAASEAANDGKEASANGDSSQRG
jgi:hypothetical protein